MAADLVEKPSLPQTAIHDVESIYWVLLWICLSFLENSLSPGLRSSILNTTMNPKAYDGTGGRNKAGFISNCSSLDGLVFPNNTPMTDVLQILHYKLGARYREIPAYLVSVIRSHAAPDRTQSAEQSIEQSAEQGAEQGTKQGAEQGAEQGAKQSKKSDHEEILNILKVYLSCDGWPDEDPAVLQELLLSEEETFAFYSGSKRSRSVAKRNGVFGALPPAKRL